MMKSMTLLGGNVTLRPTSLLQIIALTNVLPTQLKGHILSEGKKIKLYFPPGRILIENVSSEK